MESKKQERLLSLDALRGFDMFWIMGGCSIIITLAESTKWSFLEALVPQMHHADFGKGFHFLDLIFPLFMFISGVAIPFAVSAKAEAGAKKSGLLKKIVKRAAILVILGIIYNGALANGFKEPRLASVLGQIGLGYLFAASIVLYTKTMKARILWVIGILSGIAILQLLIPIPGYGAGNFDKIQGINGFIDVLLLPGREIHDADPEGILCIISAISVTLMGALAGSVLRYGAATPRKAAILAVSGASLITIALLLSPVYPIIKYIWTVPFNLLTTGISFLLLAIFYFVIDVKGWTKGAMSYIILFFTVFGMNSITIYLATRFVNFGQPAHELLGWLAIPLGGWVYIIGYIATEFMFLYYLYKNKIFLKV